MSGANTSSLARKLNLKESMKIRVLSRPGKLNLGDVAVTNSARAEGILLFVKSLAELKDKSAPLVKAARQDQLAWVAYPKAGQLGTDLNRDILWQHLQKQGIEGVRQIAIDEVWSALRFRPGK